MYENDDEMSKPKESIALEVPTMLKIRRANVSRTCTYDLLPLSDR